MQSESEEIDDGELILRRIPPPLSDNTKLEGSHWRPLSPRMQLFNKGDSGLSCTRLEQTPPSELLRQLNLLDNSKDIEGWGVCVLKVGDVRELGLDVVHKPEEHDPGHCEIQGSFTRKTPKKLAKISRMLSDDEVATGNIAEF